NIRLPVGTAERWLANRGRWSSKLLQLLQRIDLGLKRKKLVIVFRLGYKRFLWSVNPRRYGFIAESMEPGLSKVPVADRYRTFWFEGNREPELVLQRSPMV